jgi:hypothetical protein
MMILSWSLLLLPVLQTRYAAHHLLYKLQIRERKKRDAGRGRDVSSPSSISDKTEEAREKKRKTRERERSIPEALLG